MIRQIKIKTFHKTKSVLKSGNNLDSYKVRYFYDTQYITFSAEVEEMRKVNGDGENVMKIVILLGIDSKSEKEETSFFNLIVKEEATEEETKAFFENFQMILDNGEDFALELEESKNYKLHGGSERVLYTLSALGVSKEMNRRFQGLKEFS